MAGRGKPRKLNSLDAECTKVSFPDLTEGKQSEKQTKQKPKKAEQKNPNKAEEKFPPDSARGESQHSRAQRTCATRTKSTEQLPLEKLEKKEIPKTTRTKRCSDRTKSQGLEEEVKSEGTEICAGKAKSPPAKACGAKPKVEVQSVVQDTKVAPGKSEDLKRKDMTEEKASTDYILKETLKKMKIKMTDKANAAEVINAIIKNIINHLKQNTSSFNDVQEPLKTGSYYENLKVRFYTLSSRN